jgi:hypothetical protein
MHCGVAVSTGENGEGFCSTILLMLDPATRYFVINFLLSTCRTLLLPVSFSYNSLNVLRRAIASVLCFFLFV